MSVLFNYSIILIVLTLSSSTLTCTYKPCLIACNTKHGYFSVGECSGITCNCYHTKGAWLGGFDLP